MAGMSTLRAGPMQFVDSGLRQIDQPFTQACWSWCLWPHLFKDLEAVQKPAEGNEDLRPLSHSAVAKTVVEFLAWANGD
jgi:hypothetical protein